MSFAPHSRVSFGGKLKDLDATGFNEIWQCNISVINATLGAGFNNGTYLTEMAPALRTWFGNAASHISSGATLEYVKCNAITADGKYADQNNTNVFDYQGDFMQGGYTAVNPDIISVCTTWRTSKARGPGSHGRIYLPNNTYGTATGMKISADEQVAACQAGKSLLDVIENTAQSTPVFAVVASKVNATNTRITTVQVGNVKDVQRRRKDALKEVYSALTRGIG